MWFKIEVPQNKQKLMATVTLATHIAGSPHTNTYQCHGRQSAVTHHVHWYQIHVYVQQHIFTYICVSTRRSNPSHLLVSSNNLFALFLKHMTSTATTENHRHVKCSHSVKHLFSASARGINPKDAALHPFVSLHVIAWHLVTKRLCQQLHSRPYESKGGHQTITTQSDGSLPYPPLKLKMPHIK